MQKTVLFLLLLMFSTGIWAQEPRFFSAEVIESLKQIAWQHGVSAQNELLAIQYTGQNDYFNGNCLRHAVLLFGRGARMAVRVRLNPTEALLGVDSINVHYR